MGKNHFQTESLLREIVPSKALQIKVAEYTGENLVLEAPLAPNRNDKGTAFAGSIASILALAGWGLITLQLRDAGISAEVVLTRSETKYKCPVRSDMRAVAAVDEMEIRKLAAELSAGKRGRISTKSELLSGGKLCAVMHPQYAVFPSVGK